MEAESKFAPVFDRLKALMAVLAPGCVVLHDEPGKYYLSLPPIPDVKKDLWFGGVEIKKNYVSYHLMPVYVKPELLQDVSEALKKKMQGKSCFNFRKVDEALFTELGELTQRGFTSLQAYYSPSAPGTDKQ